MSPRGSGAAEDMLTNVIAGSCWSQAASPRILTLTLQVLCELRMGREHAHRRAGLHSYLQFLMLFLLLPD